MSEIIIISYFLGTDVGKEGDMNGFGGYSVCQFFSPYV